jgi:hypothetical protein
MFDACLAAGQFRQGKRLLLLLLQILIYICKPIFMCVALGIALESRRADIVQRTLETAASVGQGEASLLRYCVQQCTTHATALEWRYVFIVLCVCCSLCSPQTFCFASREVLQLAYARYQAAASQDYVAAAHCLLHLGDSDGLAALLQKVR